MKFMRLPKHFRIITILLVVVGVVAYISGRRAGILDASPDLEVHLKVFSPPLVLPASPDKMAEPDIAQIIAVNSAMLLTKTWQEFQDLNIAEPKNDKSVELAKLESEQKARWERRDITNNPRINTLFSCIVASSGKEKIAFAHFMATEWKDGGSPPGFPFMAVRCFRLSTDGMWKFDQRLSKAPLTNFLLAHAPATLPANEKDIKKLAAEALVDFD